GARQFVAAGAALTLDFTCVDAASGVAVCGMAAPSGAPLDTATPGWKSVAAAASDAAGNLGTVSVEYFVSSGVCLEPLPGLKYWQRFQNDLRDWAGQTQYGGLSNMSYSWMQGVVGTAFYFPSRYYGFMDQYHAGKLDFAGAMTAALWIRPESTGLATLLDNAQQYRLDREADGAIRWTIYGPDRAVEGTGVSTTRTPLNAWSHVTFTYAAGEVKLYIDGRPDGVWTVTPTTLNAVAHSSGDHLIIGAFGPFYATNYYVGGIDDLEMFDRALEPAEIEALFLAAGSGMCPAKATRLEIPNITLRYDAGTLPIRVTLLTVDGEPVAGRTVRITNTVINPQDPAMTLTAVTDATGTVRWDAPLNARPAIYAQGISAISFPDLQYLGAPYTTARVVVEAIPTQVTWATPAPVTYGTALGAAQLNATADVAGSFSYTPGFNTVLAAGTRTLSVRFTPSAVGYAISTTTVTLEVRKAVPVMSVTGGPFTYDGQPHAAVATVRDYRGVALTPVTVTYNGAPAIPVAPGTYAVAATYAGDVNHEPRTVTTTLTIAQATPGISFSAATFTYDGAPHGLTATVTGVGGAALGTVPVTYDGSAAAPVDAGTYTASATFGGDANHAPRTVTTTLRIDRATATVTVDTGSFTFDGQPHPAVATVRGVNGAALSPVTITYGGSSNVPVNAGTYAVVASFAGDTNHLPASATATLVIGRASAVLGWTTLAPISYGTALGAAQLGATASVAGTFQYAPAAGAVLAAGVHTLTATFTPADAQNYQNGTVSTTVTVERAAAAITVGGGPFSYDGQPHGATVAAVGAGGAALTPLTVTYNGSPALPVNAGVYAVAATFAGDTNHQPASAAGTLVIAKAVASLTWATPAPLPYGTPLSAAQLNAAANAPGTFSYAPAAGAVLGVGAGHVLTATFTPADPQNHEGGTVSTTLIIEPATATISLAGGSFVYDGQPHAATASATGVGGVELSPISVTYDGGAAAPVDAGAYVVAATFEGDAYHAARTVTASLTISPAVPTIAIGGGPFVYDGQPHAASVTVTGVGGETLPAAVSLTYAGSTLAPTGVGTYPVQASVAAAGNYAAASTTGTIVIGKATPVVTWTVEPIVYGTNLWDRHHTATANVPGGFAYAEDVMLVLPAGVQTLTATFHPLDWQNYEQTTVTTTILVRRATPTLGLQFYNLVYDGQPHEAGASARGKDWEPLSPVTVTYNGGTEIPRNAGTYVITASYPGNESYEPVSTTITREIYRAAVSSMSWGGGGMLVYGMPIGPEQLQATASVPGTFSYAPGAGTVLPAGSHVITATFTPTDPNYN
ncbi:MAG TPA: MBG domain-containing protein, partial [Micromonosporaceae bacterium]|nr:MBG domain-containing protein [Micromonosporaceae bacterium]